MEKEKKFIALYGELNSPEDFLTVPFEILEYRRELNITASEFTFICEIFHLTSKDLNEIKDKDITENRISFFRQRKSLKSKGYLKTKILNGNKKCGTIYDFTELKKIIDKLKKSKLKKSKKETETKIKVETKNDINQKYEEDAFIKKYNGLLLKLLGVDFSNYQKAQNGIKKYLLEAFRNRKNPINKSLKIAEQSFLKLPIENRNYLKLQDCMKNALLNEIENNDLEKETKAKDKKSIPNGIDNLNKLLKVIEKKGDINETYKTITNTA